MMKLNDPLIDPDGRPARLVTMPIPGRPIQLAIILYDDGRGRLIDLAQCRPAGSNQTSTTIRSNNPSPTTNSSTYP